MSSSRLRRLIAGSPRESTVILVRLLCFVLLFLLAVAFAPSASLYGSGGVRIFVYCASVCFNVSLSYTGALLPIVVGLILVSFWAISSLPYWSHRNRLTWLAAFLLVSIIAVVSHQYFVLQGMFAGSLSSLGIIAILVVLFFGSEGGSSMERGGESGRTGTFAKQTVLEACLVFGSVVFVVMLNDLAAVPGLVHFAVLHGGASSDYVIGAGGLVDGLFLYPATAFVTYIVAALVSLATARAMAPRAP